MRAWVVVVALLSCRARGTSASDGGGTGAIEAAAAKPLGKITLARVDGDQAKLALFPVDSVWGVVACYDDGLLKNPHQAGDLAVTLTPPPKDGDIALSLTATGSLDTAVVDCVRSSLGRYHVWPGGTRQQKVSTTLHLEPVEKTVPAPPTERVVRQVLESRRSYPKDVVRITSVNVLSTRQGQRYGLYRGYDCSVQLEFLREGYEMKCQGELGPYRRFRATPPDADVEMFPCEKPIARHKGDRTVDGAEVSLQLVEGKGWSSLDGDTYYCGEGPCP